MEMEGGKDSYPPGETASRWASCLCLAYALAIRRSASGSTQWYLRSLAASDEEEKGGTQTWGHGGLPRRRHPS